MKLIPQPISLSTNSGYIMFSVITAAPMGIPFPGWRSGMPNAARQPGRVDELWSYLIDSSSIRECFAMISILTLALG